MASAPAQRKLRPSRDESNINSSTNEHGTGRATAQISAAVNRQFASDSRSQCCRPNLHHCRPAQWYCLGRIALEIWLSDQLGSVELGSVELGSVQLGSVELAR